MINIPGGPLCGLGYFVLLHYLLSYAVTVSWALDLTPDTGFKIVAIHPGAVKTEMADEKFR